MKTKTLSRGLNRLRKCVALLVTCSLLLMIFAPASQAWTRPSPSKPISFQEADEIPWSEADSIGPDNNEMTPQFECSYVKSCLIVILIISKSVFNAQIGIESEKSLTLKIGKVE